MPMGPLDGKTVPEGKLPPVAVPVGKLGEPPDPPLGNGAETEGYEKGPEPGTLDAELLEPEPEPESEPEPGPEPDPEPEATVGTLSDPPAVTVTVR